MNEQSLFANLHKIIKKNGLLKKQPQYYDAVIIRNFLMLGSVVVLAALVQKYTENFLYEIPVAIMLGFVFGQFGFLAHDIGHQQVSSRFFPLALIRYFPNIFLYLPSKGWDAKHNLHHCEPNNVILDPDCEMPIPVFTQQQAQTREGLYRFLVKYQPYVFLPISSLTGLSVRITGIRYLLKKKCVETLFELLLIGASFFAYMILWTSIFGVSKAVLFLLLSELAVGIYMGMAFIVNHYGRSCTLQPETDFLTKQVETARNITSQWKPLDTIIHFVSGGLNCQIEHHLWPYMPRCNLRKARRIVQEYCARYAIDYHSVSLFRAYREVFLHFFRISKYVS